MYALFMDVNEVVRDHKLDLVHLSPGQIKSLAHEASRYPKGWRMGKSSMIQAAREVMANTPPRKFNNDQADAFLVGWAAMRFFAFLEAHGGGRAPDELWS